MKTVVLATQGDGDEEVGFPGTFLRGALFDAELLRPIMSQCLRDACAGLAATAVGIVASPVVLWSEYTLWQTGCGLPAGPGGALGGRWGDLIHNVYSLQCNEYTYYMCLGTYFMKASCEHNLTYPDVSHFAALEGISYLAVVGIAGWSLYTKITTGKGLPAGPAGTYIVHETRTRTYVLVLL